LESCRQIVPKKPVIVLKAGRSESGAKAAALHTGSLAGSDRVVDGALMQARVFRAYDEEELVDLARALNHGRPFTGGRVAILTTAGGMGVIAADLLESRDRGVGLKLAPLSEGGKAKLRSLLLPFASANNPVDVTANASNDHYAAALEVLESEPDLDAILCVMQFQSPFVDERLMDIITDWFHRGEKSIVVTSIGGELSQRALKNLTESGVPAYPSIWRGVRAIGALHKRGVWASANSKR
jgi:acyl-CoA synthetase (NDP forming)